MPEQPPREQPKKIPTEREVPLRLADDTGDGSTLPVVGSPSRTDGPTPGSEISEASAPAATSGSSAGPAGGTSTGGFETLLGKLVVRHGFATQEEVEACTALLGESSSAGDEPQTLSDLLVAREYVTRHQLNRLEQEFEAKKSSQRIPGYKIGPKLGSGAMATVFLAKQVSLDRLVAIKILPQKFSNNEKFIERFYKEGRAAAQLNHPNIVGAYDVGRAGDHHYFVMEYVDGYTVFDRIAKKKRVKEKEAIEIVRQVALALAHAHERGFVHRDIKPKNIMISKSGVVKLADLGLARAMSDKDAAKAEAGRAYGTPYYISPEQIRGELNIGPAADIYGLGATFYHMVTGRVPYEGKNPSSVMHKHLKESLEPPDHINPELSTGCAQIIEMMMAKRPRERYHSASDLIEDLNLVAKGESPHFAHRTLDHGMVTEALTDVVEAPAAIPVVTEPARANLVGSPLFLALVITLVVSVIANLVLIAILAV